MALNSNHLDLDLGIVRVMGRGEGAYCAGGSESGRGIEKLFKRARGP